MDNIITGILAIKSVDFWKYIKISQFQKLCMYYKH